MISDCILLGELGIDKDYWDVEFSIGREFDVTGGGDAFAIFSTILDCLKTFIKKKKPEILKFSAYKSDDSTDIDSDSRVSLYSSMLRKFATKLGYDFKEVSELRYKKFILTKKA